jgi:hypothetical protein
MLGKPVVRCLAKHNSPEAKKMLRWGCRRLAEGDSPGLKGKNHDHLQCVDFKRCVKFILLLQFIVIDFLGLVNGCQGIVKKFCYLPGSDVRINLLSVVFIQCNRYSGIKQVLPHQVMRELFCPGFRLFRWPHGGMTELGRTQLPLTLAWAITIDKS